MKNIWIKNFQIDLLVAFVVKKVEHTGNNPTPIANTGVCCNLCNEVVLLVRLGDITKDDAENKLKDVSGK